MSCEHDIDAFVYYSSCTGSRSINGGATSIRSQLSNPSRRHLDFRMKYVKCLALAFMALLPIWMAGCGDDTSAPDDSDSEDDSNGGGQCRLEPAHFDVPGVGSIYRPTGRSMGAAQFKGCNGQGTCGIAPQYDMIPSSDPALLPNSEARLHSFINEDRVLNNARVAIVSHDLMVMPVLTKVRLLEDVNDDYPKGFEKVVFRAQIRPCFMLGDHVSARFIQNNRASSDSGISALVQQHQQQVLRSQQVSDLERSSSVHNRNNNRVGRSVSPLASSFLHLDQQTGRLSDEHTKRFANAFLSEMVNMVPTRFVEQLQMRNRLGDHQMDQLVKTSLQPNEAQREVEQQVLDRASREERRMKREMVAARTGAGASLRTSDAADDEDLDVVVAHRVARNLLNTADSLVELSAVLDGIDDADPSLRAWLEPDSDDSIDSSELTSERSEEENSLSAADGLEEGTESADGEAQAAPRVIVGDSTAVQTEDINGRSSSSLLDSSQQQPSAEEAVQQQQSEDVNGRSCSSVADSTSSQQQPSTEEVSAQAQEPQHAPPPAQPQPIPAVSFEDQQQQQQEDDPPAAVVPPAATEELANPLHLTSEPSAPARMRTKAPALIRTLSDYSQPDKEPLISDDDQRSDAATVINESLDALNPSAEEWLPPLQPAEGAGAISADVRIRNYQKHTQDHPTALAFDASNTPNPSVASEMMGDDVAAAAEHSSEQDCIHEKKKTTHRHFAQNRQSTAEAAKEAAALGDGLSDNSADDGLVNVRSDDDMEALEAWTALEFDASSTSNGQSASDGVAAAAEHSPEAASAPAAKEAAAHDELSDYSADVSRESARVHAWNGLTFDGQEVPDVDGAGPRADTGDPDGSKPAPGMPPADVAAAAAASPAGGDAGGVASAHASAPTGAAADAAGSPDPSSSGQIGAAELVSDLRNILQEGGIFDVAEIITKETPFRSETDMAPGYILQSEDRRDAAYEADIRSATVSNSAIESLFGRVFDYFVIDQNSCFVVKNVAQLQKASQTPPWLYLYAGCNILHHFDNDCANAGDMVDGGLPDTVVSRDGVLRFRPKFDLGKSNLFHTIFGDSVGTTGVDPPAVPTKQTELGPTLVRYLEEVATIQLPDLFDRANIISVTENEPSYLYLRHHASFPEVREFIINELVLWKWWTVTNFVADEHSYLVGKAPGIVPRPHASTILAHYHQKGFDNFQRRFKTEVTARQDWELHHTDTDFDEKMETFFDKASDLVSKCHFPPRDADWSVKQPSCLEEWLKQTNGEDAALRHSVEELVEGLKTQFCSYGRASSSDMQILSAAGALLSRIDSALMLAIKHGWGDSDVDMLVRSGAAVNSRWQVTETAINFTPIHAVAWTGRVAHLNILLDAMNGLMYSHGGEYEPMMDIMLNKSPASFNNADFELPPRQKAGNGGSTFRDYFSDGASPLHFAVGGQNLKCVQVLLERGASVVVKDQKRRTPFHLAAQRGNVDIADRLKSHFSLADAGHDVLNAVDSEGNTPLMLATKVSDNEAMVRWLAVEVLSRLSDTQMQAAWPDLDLDLPSRIPNDPSSASTEARVWRAVAKACDLAESDGVTAVQQPSWFRQNSGESARYDDILSAHELALLKILASQRGITISDDIAAAVPSSRDIRDSVAASSSRKRKMNADGSTPSNFPPTGHHMPDDPTDMPRNSSPPASDELDAAGAGGGDGMFSWYESLMEEKLDFAKIWPLFLTLNSDFVRTFRRAAQHPNPGEDFYEDFFRRALSQLAPQVAKNIDKWIESSDRWVIDGELDSSFMLNYFGNSYFDSSNPFKSEVMKREMFKFKMTTMIRYMVVCWIRIQREELHANSEDRDRIAFVDYASGLIYSMRHFVENVSKALHSPDNGHDNYKDLLLTPVGVNDDVIASPLQLKLLQLAVKLDGAHTDTVTSSTQGVDWNMVSNELNQAAGVQVAHTRAGAFEEQKGPSASGDTLPHTETTRLPVFRSDFPGAGSAFAQTSFAQSASSFSQLNSESDSDVEEADEEDTEVEVGSITDMIAEIESVLKELKRFAVSKIVVDNIVGAEALAPFSSLKDNNMKLETIQVLAGMRKQLEIGLLATISALQQQSGGKDGSDNHTAAHAHVDPMTKSFLKHIKACARALRHAWVYDAPHTFLLALQEFGSDLKSWGEAGGGAALVPWDADVHSDQSLIRYGDSDNDLVDGASVNNFVGIVVGSVTPTSNHPSSSAAEGSLLVQDPFSKNVFAVSRAASIAPGHPAMRLFEMRIALAAPPSTIAAEHVPSGDLDSTSSEEGVSFIQNGAAGAHIFGKFSSNPYGMCQCFDGVGGSNCQVILNAPRPSKNNVKPSSSTKNNDIPWVVWASVAVLILIAAGVFFLFRWQSKKLMRQHDEIEANMDKIRSKKAPKTKVDPNIPIVDPIGFVVPATSKEKEHIILFREERDAEYPPPVQRENNVDDPNEGGHLNARTAGNSTKTKGNHLGLFLPGPELFLAEKKQRETIIEDASVVPNYGIFEPPPGWEPDWKRFVPDKSTPQGQSGQQPSNTTQNQQQESPMSSDPQPPSEHYSDQNGSQQQSSSSSSQPPPHSREISGATTSSGKALSRFNTFDSQQSCPELAEGWLQEGEQIGDGFVRRNDSQQWAGDYSSDTDTTTHPNQNNPNRSYENRERHQNPIYRFDRHQRGRSQIQHSNSFPRSDQSLDDDFHNYFCEAPPCTAESASYARAASSGRGESAQRINRWIPCYSSNSLQSTDECDDHHVASLSSSGTLTSLEAPSTPLATVFESSSHDLHCDNRGEQPALQEIDRNSCTRSTNDTSDRGGSSGSLTPPPRNSTRSSTETGEMVDSISPRRLLFD